MKASMQELEERLEHFKRVCREAGIKLTHQRLEIFREVAQAVDHPDAEKVFNRVRERLPMISLDTVYRNLWLANDLGLINIILTSQERTRFDANLKKHHHFVCINCDLTGDFYSEELDQITLPDSIKQLGVPETTQVEVRGLCHKCSDK